MTRVGHGEGCWRRCSTEAYYEATTARSAPNDPANHVLRNLRHTVVVVARKKRNKQQTGKTMQRNGQHNMLGGRRRKKLRLPKNDGSAWAGKGRRRRKANCSSSLGSEMDRLVVVGCGCKSPIGVMDGRSLLVGRSNMTDIFAPASHAPAHVSSDSTKGKMSSRQDVQSGSRIKNKKI